MAIPEFQVHSFKERNTGAEQHFECNIMSPYRALSFAERQRCASCFGTASLGPKWRKGQFKQFSSSKGNSVFSSLSHSCHSVNVFGVGRNCNLDLDQNTGDRIWATIAITPYFPPAAQKLEMVKTRGLAAFQKGAWTKHLLAAPIAPSLYLEKSPAIVSSKQTYNWAEHVIPHSHSLFLQKMLKDGRSEKNIGS